LINLHVKEFGDQFDVLCFIQLATDFFVFIRCVQKKTPIHVFFYSSVENVYIFTKFSRNVWEETSITFLEKVNIFCY